MNQTKYFKKSNTNLHKIIAFVQFLPSSKLKNKILYYY